MKTKIIRKLNAVIGNPLTHSKSPRLHALMYERLKIDAALLPFPHEDVAKLVSAIRTMSIGLTAVTMPHKKNVMPLLDFVDPGAKAIGAVNTILNANRKLRGYNTDLDGIRYALRHCRMKGKNVLIIGAGGAASAVAYVVKKAGGKAMYVDRTISKARRLQRRFGGRVVSPGTLSAKDVEVIINATPVGMHPDSKSMAVPASLVAKHQFVFDLVYNPLETLLLKTAKKKGAKIVSGIDMFIVQGMRQVELWTGESLITPTLVHELKTKIMRTI